MNDVLYRDLIETWIIYDERPILQKRDIWLYAARILNNNKKWCSVLVDIQLHTGIPCVRRYCVCTYFSIEDKIDFYNRNKPLIELFI